MSATIEVNKQSVKDLLKSGKEHLFVIPEYQRPYAWNNDQIVTLFEDLFEFTENRVAKNKEKDASRTYFLGSIVSYENADGEQEIIDGQQRITSLFLLLRAIYTHIEKEDVHTKEATNFMNQIENAIWMTDNMTGEVDKESILLDSRVMSNDGNEILRNILRTGIANEKAKDAYSLNYILLSDLVDEASSNSLFFEFIYSVLNCAILLPITADTQDTALTIFSTLNDRGLQLSDADIFKAKIYNNLNTDDKKKFITDWKLLEMNAEESRETVQSLFYYYMFYLRALEGDVKSTTPGLRKYYARDKFQKLYEPNLLKDLQTVLNLWYVVNMHSTLDDESWSHNSTIIQLLDVLNSYSNEFWKYPVVVYYLKYRNEDDFELNFKLFLQKLANELLTNFLEAPTINVVKQDIMKLNYEISKSNKPKFEFKEINNDDLLEKISKPHVKAVRMLLKIHAYCSQDDILPDKWEIEHILPQRYQSSFFMEESDDVIKEKIEHLGNKLPIEKKINIVAGNGYFAKKKEIYLKSNIKDVKDMAHCPVREWNLDDIIQRDLKVADKIINVLKRWDNEYVADDNCHNNNQPKPTPEEQKMIDDLRNKGLI